jgi:hypothetical protein
VDFRITDSLHRIESPEGAILAYACPCGKPIGKEWAIVEWEDSLDGIKHSICHTKCLEQHRKATADD